MSMVHVAIGYHQMSQAWSATKSDVGVKGLGLVRPQRSGWPALHADWIQQLPRAGVVNMAPKCTNNMRLSSQGTKDRGASHQCHVWTHVLSSPMPAADSSFRSLSCDQRTIQMISKDGSRQKMGYSVLKMYLGFREKRKMVKTVIENSSFRFCLLMKEQ